MELQTASRFLLACRQKPSDITPVWFMRQAGRYMPEYRKIREKHDILSICRQPELAAEVTLQPVAALDVDAAILFSDLLLPLEPMGIPFHFASGEGPVIDQPIAAPSDVSALHPVHPEESLGHVLEALRLVKRHLSGKVPVIGFAGAPFTLASYALEGGHSQTFLKTKQFMVRQPEAWRDLMERFCTITADYLLAQIRAGADAVQIFDSWVGALSPDDYQHHVLPYSARVIQAVRQTGIPLIHFSTGTAGMLPLVSQAGGDVIGIDWRIPLDEAWNRVGSAKAIQGNLDPAALFAPLPVLKSAVEEIMRKAAGKPGHIFNLGHGILPQTPVDHVKRVVEWVRRYRP